MSGAFFDDRRSLPPHRLNLYATIRSAYFCALWAVITVLLSGCMTTERHLPESSSVKPVRPASSRIPLEAFASLPQVRTMALSPSGTSIAFIQNVDDKTYLVTTTHDGKQRRKLFESDNATYSLRWFRWMNDERLIIGVAVADASYGLGGAYRWTQTRLLAVNRDGSDLKTDLVVPFGDIRGLSREHVPQLQDRIIGTIPGDSRSVLIALDLRNPTYPDVYQLDVYTGRRELVERSTHGIRTWMADRQGAVRVGIAVDGTIVHILVKPVGQEHWRTLAKYDALIESGMSPLGFDEDPNTLFVEQLLEGRTAVYSINISDPQVPPILRASHASYDVEGGLVYSSWLKRAVGVNYHADESKTIYWNAEAKELQASIDLALPGRSNTIHSSSQTGRRHIVVSSHATQPPQWYLFDVELNRLHLMLDEYPNLAAKDLVNPTPVSLKARDGTVLHGYVTRPGNAQQPVPLVVLPHGGPGSRDLLDFDYWVQFFVSRGWAVLQVNFRGSSGYGRSFWQAGLKRWGLEMQDDLTDATQYAIDRNLADPQRMCIVGGSYGGYAALMGVVKTPELFRCAVSFAGVSDLQSLLEDKRQFLGYELGAERQLGSLWSERSRLNATSPVNHADKIRSPLLIVHGVEDRTVPVEQSRAMVGALKSADFTDLRYVELPDGDHHLSRQADRVTFFREMERFLATHLDRPGQETGVRTNR